VVLSAGVIDKENDAGRVWTGRLEWDIVVTWNDLRGFILRVVDVPPVSLSEMWWIGAAVDFKEGSQEQKCSHLGAL